MCDGSKRGGRLTGLLVSRDWLTVHTRAGSPRNRNTDGKGTGKWENGVRKRQNNRVVPFLARDPSSAESATYLKKKMYSLIQNTFSGL